MERLYNKRDGKKIIDIIEYNFDEKYCIAVMEDGETKKITDEDFTENYDLMEEI